jgi:hypothetical protein
MANDEIGVLNGYAVQRNSGETILLHWASSD